MECYAIVAVDDDGSFYDDPLFEFDSKREAEAACMERKDIVGYTWVVLECCEVWSKPAQSQEPTQ